MKNNTTIKFLVLFIAVILWFHQILIKTHSLEINIPIKLIKTPQSLIPDSSKLPEVAVEISATGKDILLFQLSKKSFQIDTSHFRYGKNQIVPKAEQLVYSKKIIINRFETSDGSLKALISILLDEYRLLENKQRVGVKYPLHFSRIHLLNEWFSDAKILFLYRDTRAVCASKVNDEASVIRKKKLGFLSGLVHYGTLGFFVFEYIWFSSFFIKNKKALNIYPVCYENLLMEPEKEIRKICEFCEIPFEKKMLAATGKPSSYTSKITSGVDIKRLFAWKKRITKFDVYLITLLTKKSMKKLGYKFKGFDIDC